MSGLKGTELTFGRFLNLFRLPLAIRLGELEDAGRWDSEDERLHLAEQLLEHQVTAEKEHLAWPNRAPGLTVITVIDLLIWLVWGDWVMALINQAIAMTVSQIHISMSLKRSCRPSRT
ncbi:MAG: hypothetical protein SWK76_06705 [Actinomycetota bacterium]|nr:hypothetical protein [Actinomycetota bacterium]